MASVIGSHGQQLVVTPEVVVSKINNMKENKSPGVDGISPKILHVWGNSVKIKKIITQQKRAIRTINKVWYRSHTEPLFKSNQILNLEDMYTMQISLFVYDLNNDLLPKSFRNVLSQNCLARHGIINRQNNLISQSRPRTTFSSKLPKHNFTRIWNKTGSTLAHGTNRLTFKRVLKNSYLEAYTSHIKCINPGCTDCYDK